MQLESDVGFLEWTKAKQTELSKTTGRAKSDKTQPLPKHLPTGELSKIIMKDFKEYKEHLERDYVMKKEIKIVRLQALDNDELASYRQNNIQSQKSKKYSQHISMGGILMICTQNTATRKMTQDQDQKHYADEKLCEEFKISIRLLFTEAGHGKSQCDGVGGNVKTQFEIIALDIHGNKKVLAIHNAQDVARILKERTNLSYDIIVHQHDNDKTKNNLGKLSPLVGALKVHDVFIGDDLVIKKKNLPSDPFYKAVLIKPTFGGLYQAVRSIL